MKREMNFFGDPSIISNTHPVGSEPHLNSPSEMDMSQHRGDRNFMTGQIQDTTRSHQEQFSSRAHEIGMIRQETQSVHDPVLGFQWTAAPAFGVPTVTMETYFGVPAAAVIANGVPLISVWNGVCVVHSYPIPSGEEHDYLGTGLTTRNFLGAMEQPLNADYANQVRQSESPELMSMVTHPIVDLDPKEVDLDLKL